MAAIAALAVFMPSCGKDEETLQPAVENPVPTVDGAPTVTIDAALPSGLTTPFSYVIFLEYGEKTFGDTIQITSPPISIKFPAEAPSSLQEMNTLFGDIDGIFPDDVKCNEGKIRLINTSYKYLRVIGEEVAGVDGIKERYFYVDKDVSASRSYDGVIFNVKMKTGWNIVYFIENGDTMLVTTSTPSNYKRMWILSE
jgi:hypothetical protein